MKKLVYLIVVLVALGLIVAGCGLLTVPSDKGKPDDPENSNSGCATIQDGTIYASTGELLTIGYDDWGYNYQAHIFNGFYWNNQRPDPPYTKETIDEAPSKTWLVMKWSDTWLSNKDCNGDEKLDRGYACDPVNANSSACEGAWVTNHQSGEYEGEDGKTCKWTYFVKIVKAPKDAVLTDGVWYAVDGTKIGEVIWGAYAIVQQVENDTCAGLHGLQYLSPAGPGFGTYK